MGGSELAALPLDRKPVEPIMIRYLWRCLIHGCWGWHAERVKEVRSGVLHHVCPRCGDAPVLLPGQVPKIKSVCVESLASLAKGWRRAKVREWKRRA